MANKKDPSWKSYEEIAAFVLNQCAHEFGLDSVEGKQSVAGKSGTDREVDALGWADGGAAHFLVECKKHKDTGINQAITGSLAFQILDTDAKGGLLVSPQGLQKGAKKVAAASGIHEIKLDPRSTTSAYFGEWLGKLRVGFTEEAGIQISEHLSIHALDKDGKKTELYDSDKSP